MDAYRAGNRHAFNVGAVDAVIMFIAQNDHFNVSVTNICL